MDITVGSALVVAGSATVGAMMKGALGLGFPITATPLMTTVFGPETAVPAIAVPALLMNIAQAWQGRVLLRGFGAIMPVLVALVPGSVIGAYLLASLPTQFITLLVGLSVMIYSALSLIGVPIEVPPRLIRPIGGAVGLASGILGGATGIYSPLLMLFLSALTLDKETFPPLISLTFVIGQIPQLATYMGLGLLTWDRLTLSLLMVPPVVVGFVIGTSLRSRMNAAAFAAAVMVAIFVVGANLVRQALGLHLS